MRAAEQAHLQRPAIWGALSMVAGTIVWALLTTRRFHSPLLTHSATQTGACGAVDLAIALIAWRSIHLRDLTGAISLDRFL